MKKIFALLLALCMIFALAACGETAATEEPKTEETTETTEATETTEETAEVPEETTEETAEETVEEAAAAEYKLGMGIVVSTASSSSEKHLAQVDATVATVVLDAEGKIVACRIDVAQNKMDVTDGVPVPKTEEFQTKVELKDAYNMKGASAIGLEWYEQALNFENYVIGKTAAEVAAIETVQDGSHFVAVDETLKASVSMSIADFMEAIAKACADEQGMTFTAEGEFTLGLAAITTDSSKAAGEEDGSANMYTEFAAVVLDKDGKILANLQDAIQPKIPFNAAGEIGEPDYTDTKRGLKEAYGMSNIGAVEWYIQAANFEQAMLGKTAEEVGAIETVEDGEHTVFADETLKASVSISVAGMIAVLLRAMEYAR
jgi:predicted small lipoprotein YifL